MPSSFVSRANDGIDLTGIESSLQCIDAEILAFDKESLVLRSFVAGVARRPDLGKDGSNDSAGRSSRRVQRRKDQ